MGLSGGSFPNIRRLFFFLFVTLANSMVKLFILAGIAGLLILITFLCLIVEGWKKCVKARRKKREETEQEESGGTKAESRQSGQCGNGVEV